MGYRRREEEVAGAFENNFKVRFHGHIDGEDFCRAVRRCLIRDLLVAGANDEEDRDEHCHCRHSR
ncbi:hypothetical protein [Bacillus massilinigeriensis]|uniref:hypothetical protein n=1 Tax=Bacillus mediterraneensis TaxID=1805474 RepID=UPI0008F81773|nr:hypothetical protein [Bacillus mediterraneensis]